MNQQFEANVVSLEAQLLQLDPYVFQLQEVQKHFEKKIEKGALLKVGALT